MAGREYREVRKRLSDEPASTSPHIGYARVLLGMLKEFMRFNKLQQLSWTKDYPGGVRITVSSIFGQDTVDIQVPPPSLRRGKWVERFIDVKSGPIILVNYYRQDAGKYRTTCLWEGGKPTSLIATGPGSNFGTDISYDGQAVSLAYGPVSNSMAAARWTKSGGIEIIDPQFAPGVGVSQAQGISADGETLCGYRWTGTTPAEPFIWTKKTGLVPLVRGGVAARTYGISADGGTVVGDFYDGMWRACYWEDGDGPYPIPSPPGYPMESAAFAVSDDGGVIVGVSWGFIDEVEWITKAAAWRWTKKTGTQMLPPVPGYDKAIALAVSRDGSVISGRVQDNDTASVSQAAFRWTEKTGTVVLPGRYSNSDGMTQDGDILVGNYYGSTVENPCMWVNGSLTELNMDGAVGGCDIGYAIKAVMVEREISDGFHYEDTTNP